MTTHPMTDELRGKASHMSYLDDYVQYIKNTRRVPLKTEWFDEDHEPIGPRVRADMVNAGLITVQEDGIRLVDPSAPRAWASVWQRLGGCEVGAHPRVARMEMRDNENGFINRRLLGGASLADRPRLGGPKDQKPPKNTRIAT